MKSIESTQQREVPLDPRTMFLDTSKYPICRYLESNFETILAECTALSKGEYANWIYESAYQGGWKIAPIVLHDLEALDVVRPAQKAVRALCPKTTEILERIPELLLGGFSLFPPGTHAFPHTDSDDPPIYRFHLGLITPPDCWLRMHEKDKDMDTRGWEAGKSLAFDGNTLHEAANLGQEDRIVLICDLLRTKSQVQVPA